MKIDRRCFLSFVIGGAAGTALTPLPWKLTDDLSIWSQMWPWVPVPADGEASYVTSACTLCPGGCGITVRKIDQRVVKIEGLAGHPVNDGGICPLGLSGVQLLYGPTRVKTPMQKVNGNWQQISWEHAIAMLAGKISELRAAGKSEALACISGSNRGTVPALIERFLTACGSANFVSLPNAFDTYSVALAQTGFESANAGFDMENADFILSLGSGLLDGWGSPVHMFRTNSHWKSHHIKVAQVEPRLSNTAAKSGWWITIRPGTEAALALGVAHVLVNEEQYDKAFVQYNTIGFNRWRQQVLSRYTPEKVSEITGTPKDTVMILAKQFGMAQKPLAVCGKGQGSIPGSLNEVLAVNALNALKGGINRTGGMWPLPAFTTGWPQVEPDAVAAQGLSKGRLDGAGSDAYPLVSSLPHRLPQAIKDGDKPIEILLVSDTNPYHALPDSRAVQSALGKIPFKVSFSSWMDETAAACDLILPNHMYLERYEEVPCATGFAKPIISLVQPAVSPQFNTMHTGDVILRLAGRIGENVAQAFPWEDYETCLRETLAERWDTLEARGYWLDESFRGIGTGTYVFRSDPNGPSADYTPVAIEGSESGFPLLLVPYDSMRLSSGYVGSPPFMVKTVPETVLLKNEILVEINPQTAKTHGLKDGRRATLSTPKGSVKVRVHLYEGIMPGVVAMARGLGHTAYDEFLGGKGQNVNDLIGAVEDTASGLNAAWGIRAKLA